MLLTVKEVATLLRCSGPTVRALCETGILQSVKVSMRGLRIPQESLDTYMRTLSNGEVTLESVATPRRVPAPAPRTPPLIAVTIPETPARARGARRANRR